MDKIAKQIADDFFTIAPRHRTKERLASHIEDLVYLVRQLPWIIGYAAGSIKPDAAHQKELEKVMEKALEKTIT